MAAQSARFVSKKGNMMIGEEVKTMHEKTIDLSLLAYALCFLLLLLVNNTVFAAEVRTLGDMAKAITESFSNLTKLITASSYLAGLGFSIGAIMKFKQHKDNPTQTTVGAPIAMLFIASALLFLPSVLSVTSYTMFGPQGGTTAGPMGTVFFK
jgi:intracellular multiplication protein IcmD